MKLLVKLMAIILLFSMISCGDSATSTKGKTGAKTTKTVKKSKPLSSFWKKAKAQTKISHQQIAKVKKVQAKYKKLKKGTPKVNGKTNKIALNKLEKKKQAEIKKILGGKYKPYRNFVKKQAALKKKNKKK